MKKINRKKRKPTVKDIMKAKKVVRRFKRASIGNLSVPRQRELVGIWYPEINGTPISDLPENQLYGIAKRLYDQSHEIDDDLIKESGFILSNIEKLAQAKGDKWEELNDEVCSQLESPKIPFYNYLGYKYNEATKLPF